MNVSTSPVEFANEQGAASVSNSQILIVEDEPIVAMDLQYKLERMGYQVPVTVTSGEEALDQVAQNRPDLVLMDINLAGDMDGVEAARHLQLQYRIPVIYLTASSSSAILERAKITEPSGFLLKPFEERELKGTIEIGLYKHQVKEALRESEERFRILVEHAPEAIVVFDADLNRFVDANENAARLFKLEREALLEVGPVEISPPVQPDGRLSSEVAREHIQRALDGGTPVVEWLYQNAAGDHVLCENRLVRLPAAGRKLVRASITDITERKQVEQGLIALERLRALKEMAQGISHNFNNILAGVFGYAELIRRDSRDSRITSFIEQVIAGALRARDLVQCLRKAIQGINHESVRPVQINEMVQEVVQATRPCWKDEAADSGLSIDVVTQLEHVPPIRGTQPGLYDILVNLIFNAVDSMTAGGTITIAIKAVAESVQLTVSDTGIGMDETTRRRVFEPFFTTKKDVGSGLGLFTVYGTVTRWGGTIEVESAPEKGSTFTLCLPAWKESAKPQLKLLEKDLMDEDDSGGE